MKILWIDFETGGLSPIEHDITQCAGIVEIDGNVEEEFNFLVCPAGKFRVTEQALKIQGRTLEQVLAHPMSQRDLWKNLTAIFAGYVDRYNRSDKFYWAGQNAPFDMSFARALWTRNGDQYFHAFFAGYPLDLGVLAAVMQSRGHLRDLPNLKLATICNSLGAPLDQAHDALADIRATRDAYWRLASQIPEAA